MKSFDKRECQLVILVAKNGGRMSADDPRLNKFGDDRGHNQTDTFNRLFDKGVLSQVQTGEDNFVIVLGP